MTMSAKKRRKKERLGNCYESALNTMLELCLRGDESRYRLVHAEIVGQGPIDGLRHGHAFVIDVQTDVVHDRANGRVVEMPLVAYRAIARMDEASNWHVYTMKQVREWVLKTGVYGPWELVTSSGL